MICVVHLAEDRLKDMGLDTELNLLNMRASWYLSF